MRVLFVASEVYPLVKTGGLADVVGALPIALAELGVDVRVLVPGYPKVLAGLHARGREVELHNLVGGGPAKLMYGRVGKLELLVLDAPHLYNRPGNPYVDQHGRDFGDNHLRFGALCHAATWLAGPEGGDRWRPELIHGHDWQSGLVPAYVALMPPQQRVATITTIHNLAYQGVFRADVMGALRLPGSMFDIHGVEFHGHLGFLKAGLWYSDKITTVSPTYARQIQTETYGHGLQGLLRRRDADLYGILNGIDTETWNPATDPHLPAPYSADDLTGKRIGKRALQLELGLHPDPDAPLFVVVSRLVTMKGLDLLLSAGRSILERGGQLAVLGSGEERLVDGFQQAARLNPGRVAYRGGYDEPLAHRMQAGGDAIIIPSRTEPCGLTQMYGLRYGTVPVVRRTGGLADSVIDTTPETLGAGLATGVLFNDIDASALAWALGRTIALYHNRPVWQQLVRHGMQEDFSWRRSAARYLDLYRRALGY
ncbi:glycogen synthase GlgA [Nannocystis punicea]|uniref:Glycogen synthase n=1 Tax=Nannocystis punicea TaxID=2995304 RepID=A0ABY7H0Q9_9BACT|nr:glycogen synthase GlgA [Nannocystis poenicansa]WAS92797.1 glycogen synthase GlgA [Nannocystis poenicansa]